MEKIDSEVPTLLRQLIAPVRTRSLSARARALTGFFGSAALIGLGFAAVDQTQSGSNPFYYYGFAVAFLGILMLFNTAEDALFRPTWLFGLAFLIEIYGWWNVFWTLIDIPKCGGCNLSSTIILANLGALLPSTDGLVSVPIWAFFLSTALAIVVPIVIADRAPRDVEVDPVAVGGRAS